MKYKIEITETLQRVVEVKAKSQKAALEIVTDAYLNDHIVLDYKDCKGFEINPVKGFDEEYLEKAIKDPKVVEFVRALLNGEMPEGYHECKNCGAIIEGADKNALCEECELEKLKHPAKVGDKIRIVRMENEPEYEGKVGIVEAIDDIGQLHGTWGGCAVIPEIDWIEVIKKGGEN